jgi:hypothetical protein
LSKKERISSKKDERPGTCFYFCHNKLIKQKEMKKWLLVAIILVGLSVRAAAQPSGNIRGMVRDAASGQPLPYVAILILHTDPAIGTVTNEQGTFRLPPLPVGRYTIQASCLGYEPATIHQVMISPARETILEIALKESLTKLNEVVISPGINKDDPLNPMALAGARMLSVEEASRYAGGLDDPARLASSFAGVAGSVTDNSISIRGNSPQSLQWKLEGVEIPNPSHYPEVSGVGGGILTAFSSQVLANSDFFTGAFPAEYSNALSGVFDMALRNGNNQRYEHTAQVGSLGIEFASEGPFRKGSQASYLFNYRYSALALAGDLIGGDLKEVAGMRFQDLSFKINLPTRKAGVFSLWGVGTYDSLRDLLPDDLSTYDYIPAQIVTRQQMGAAGMGHKIYLGENAYLKSTLAATYARNHIMTDLYDVNHTNLQALQDMLDRNTRLVFNTYLNTKFSTRHTNRTGITLTHLRYDDTYSIVPYFPYANGASMQNITDADGSTLLIAAFSQSSYQLNEGFTLQAGLNAQYFGLNGRYTFEPRAGIRWQAAPKHAFALATGLHSRLERLDYYLVAAPENSHSFVNKKLDLAKAYHLVMSYDYKITGNTHLRIEPYFQYLYDVPIVPGTNISIINQADFYMTHPLINGGKGRNAGIDLTLERYLKDGYYYMFTASLFNSEYQATDRIWRNTRYNRRFLANAAGGKEWTCGRNRQNVLGLNLRLNLMGGDYYTPPDEAASLAAQRPIEDESRLFAGQNPASFIVHTTLYYQINKHGRTHELGIKMLNITGSKHYYGFDYNYRTQKTDRTEAAVSIPNIYYKISF